jgi:hypothetical protein
VEANGITPPESDIPGELAHGREDERTEREERRGLEARASTLLAAGAAVVGLVATAVRDVAVSGPERDRLLSLLVVASLVMVVALGMVARALSLVMTRGGHAADQGVRAHAEADVIAQQNYVDRIRKGNESMLNWLKPATLVFAVSVACFLATLMWAAYASGPPPNTTVMVRSLVGPPGPQGAAGPRGIPGPPGRDANSSPPPWRSPSTYPGP